MKTQSLLGLLTLGIGSATALGQIIPGQYIAVLKEGVPDHAAAIGAMAAQHGLAVGHIYQSALKGFAFRAAPQAVAALARRADIAYIEPDQQRHAWDQVIPTGIERVNVGEAISIGSGEPTEVDIAIIDSGLDSNHPDLRIDSNGVRFYWSRNRIVSDSKWEDDNGHGTHVGGTAAAIDNGYGVVGVAPGARLTAVKVLDQNGSGSLSGVIAGVDWVAARPERFEVANMSLGGGFSQAENDAVRKAVAKGIVFVVAAGNDSADAGSYSPASEPTAITVSALADSDGLPEGLGGSTLYGDDDTFASFSNFGSAIDICAPGVDILSTAVGGGFALGSGTSMASPHVAGAAALYIARRGLTKSAAGVEAVATALKSAGWKPGDPEYLLSGDLDGHREPLLNVGSLFGVVPDPNLPPTVTITSPSHGAVFGSGASIQFTGLASDDEDGDLTSSLVWTSSGGVQIGTGGPFRKVLADGTHTITASAVDSQDATGSASVTITVGSTVVVPSGFEVTEASGYGGTLASVLRLQEVYSKTHFSDDPVTFTSLAFRLDRSIVAANALGVDALSQSGEATTNRPPFQVVRPSGPEGDVEGVALSASVELLVRLSTTTAKPDNLSSTFSANVGADVTTVFERAWVSFEAGTGGAPNAFDIKINFETFFTYNPLEGNLLVDITTYSAAANLFVDGANATTDGASRAWSTKPNATRASVRDSGADVIQFTVQSTP
ncbi:MAG: S8 family serine peptidase [Limisphaerales bacterium]